MKLATDWQQDLFIASRMAFSRYVQLSNSIDFWGSSEFNVMLCNSITINSHIKKIQQLPVTECPESVTYTMLAIKGTWYMYIHVHSDLGVVTI